MVNRKLKFPGPFRFCLFVFYHPQLQNHPFQLDPTKLDFASFTHGIASLKLAALHIVPVPPPTLVFPARPRRPNPEGLFCEGNWRDRAELLQGPAGQPPSSPGEHATWKILKKQLEMVFKCDLIISVGMGRAAQSKC